MELEMESEVDAFNVKENGTLSADCQEPDKATDDTDKGVLCSFITRMLKRNILLISILVCVMAGFGIGFGLRSSSPSESALMWIGLPGEIFIRTMYFTIVPLIVSSIISGTATLDPKTNGKITMSTILCIIIINTTGVVMGTAVYFIIDPASFVVKTSEHANDFSASVRLQTEDIFADLIRNLFPDNLITACFQQYQTKYKTTEIPRINVTVEEYKRSVGTASGTNILGIIVACTAIGIATGKMGEAGRPIVLFFKAASDMIIIVMTWLIWLTPIGVLSLISTSIAKIESVESTFKSFGMFILAVVIANILIVVLTLFVYLLVFRKNPFGFFSSTIRPIMTGVATALCSLAVPQMLHVVEYKYKVNTGISRFCVLFGVATCRCGSGAFLVICSLFLASLEGYDLQFGQVFSVVVLSIASTLAVPATPSSAIVCVIIILSSVNVVSTNIGIVMALEWLHDRIRTVPNILCILFGTITINKLCAPEDEHIR